MLPTSVSNDPDSILTPASVVMTNENQCQLIPATSGSAISPNASNSAALAASLAANGPKRLHVSNIPFRFREADLRQLLGVSFCELTCFIR